MARIAGRNGGNRVFGYLLLLFVSVPLIELYLLFWLAGVTSPWFTLALVILTGFVGASLARWQGLQTLQRIQHELNAGRMPGEPLVDALMIFVAGALLLTPGMLTDLFGFSLLVPWFRRGYRWWLGRYFKSHVQVNVQTFTHGWSNVGQSNAADDNVVDGSVVDGSVDRHSDGRSSNSDTSARPQYDAHLPPPDQPE